MRVIIWIIICFLTISLEWKQRTHYSKPVLLIDNAHNNWGWNDSTSSVLAEFFSENGFEVHENKSLFSTSVLNGVDIVKIDNAISKEDDEIWSLPTPSAFTSEEIKVLFDWVYRGGSLVLVVEHMPFPLAFKSLLDTFKIKISNGFTVRENLLDNLSKEDVADAGYIIFTEKNGLFADHKIFQSREEFQKIDFVVTDVGSAFLLPDHAVSLLSFSEKYISLEPKVSWEFNDSTLSVSLKGWSQAGFLNVGKGKVAILGDNFLFTAPALIRPPFLEKEKDAIYGANNHTFTINFLTWLSGRNPKKEEPIISRGYEDSIPIIRIPEFDNDTPSDRIKTETQKILHEIDSFLSRLSNIERNLTVHDIPNTPVKMWYTDRKEPVKIEYGVVDDSGNFSGIFKLYFINGNLWYADQIYAKYLFKSGKLQFWLDEGWNINEVCESDFLNRQKQLVEVAALLTQDLD